VENFLFVVFSYLTGELQRYLGGCCYFGYLVESIKLKETSYLTGETSYLTGEHSYLTGEHSYLTGELSYLTGELGIIAVDFILRVCVVSIIFKVLCWSPVVLFHLQGAVLVTCGAVHLRGDPSL
jgi:hypothetical protein